LPERVAPVGGALPRPVPVAGRLSSLPDRRAAGAGGRGEGGAGDRPGEPRPGGDAGGAAVGVVPGGAEHLPGDVPGAGRPGAAAGGAGVGGGGGGGDAAGAAAAGAAARVTGFRRSRPGGLRARPRAAIRKGIRRMDNKLWLVYAIAAGLCWGTYVPFVQQGIR